MSFNTCMENFLKPFPVKDRKRVKSDIRYIKSIKAKDLEKAQKMAAKILLERIYFVQIYLWSQFRKSLEDNDSSPCRNLKIG